MPHRHCIRCAVVPDDYDLGDTCTACADEHQASRATHIDQADEVMSACVALSRSGLRLVCAHTTGTPGVVVDRRPDPALVPDLTPGTLRMDAAGCYYQASLHGLAVSWSEPRRARA
jgi:hypothetical protein